MRETLRQNEAVKFEREYNDERTTAYVVVVGDVDDHRYTVYNDNGKELAYMKALSTYLAKCNVIDKSYDECKAELNVQEIPYKRLVEIAKGLFDKLSAIDKEDVMDNLVDEEEAEFLDFVDKPYEVRTYTVTMTATTEITVAVHKDASAEESELSDYCDGLSETEWEFDHYDFDDYYTETEGISEKDLEENWNYDLKIDED